MARPDLYKAGLDIFKQGVAERVRKAKDQQLLTAFLSQQASPQDALASAAKLGQSAGSKYGSRDVGGKIRIERRWISNIMASINTFVAIGNETMKKAPESIGAAWFAVSLVLKAIQNNYALYSLFEDALTDITDLMVVITQYDRLYSEDQRSGIKDAEKKELFADIAEAYAAMLDFAFSVHQYVSAEGWDRFRHGFRDIFNVQAPEFQAKAERIATQKRRVLEKSEIAFQRGTFEGFNQVLDGLKENVEGIKTFQRASEEFYSSAQKDLTEIKLATKLRSRWDFALRDFKEIKARLDPLDNTNEPLFKELNEKLDDTCLWIRNDDRFQGWLNSEKSRMLCITGSEGSGKSILLASVFDNLKSEVSNSDYEVIYLACGIGSRLEKIRNTLIYLLYERAAADESRSDLLEKCNKLFRDAKKGNTNKVTKSQGSREPLPDLEEAFSWIPAQLGKKVIVVLDAVDRMNDAEQEWLYKALCRITDAESSDAERNSHVRLLAAYSSDSRGAFNKYIRSEGDAESINVDLHNSSDIDTKLNFELQRMSWLTESQKMEAKAAIVERAGPAFKYVVQVAIPFLREPSQEPFSDRLKHLPRGMEQNYVQHIRGLAPNYARLLRTALSWSLFASRPVRVLEIMEDFNQIYHQTPADIDLEAAETKAKFHYLASDLEIEQLKTAAGPFLHVWNEDEEQQDVVDLKDSSQVLDFCIHSDHCISDEKPDPENLCSQCQAKLRLSNTLSFTEKEGHLQAAIRCVRHLRNPLFWKRCWEWPKKDLQPSDPESPKTLGSPTSTIAEGLFQTGSTRAKTGDYGPTINGLSGNAIAEGNQDKGEDSDESSDAEDQSDEKFDQEEFGEREYAADLQKWMEDELHYRYEMARWHTHVRKAEELWSREERLNSADWDFLLAELDRLCFECPEEFAKCQQAMLLFGANDQPWQGNSRMHVSWADQQSWQNIRDMQPWKPLHVAAWLGLSSWAEHLLDRGESLAELCDDRTPMQAAACRQDSESVLELFLARGADPNLETKTEWTAFQLQVGANMSYKCAQIFLQHGAKLDTTERLGGWSILHLYAFRGTNPEVLKLLLSEQGGLNRAHINLRGPRGETLLHILVAREEVPIELLEIFIENGADVNIANDDLLTPLMLAEGYKVMKSIVPHVKDIDCTDRHGQTALHIMAASGFADCVQLLLENGADVNALDAHGGTPFFYACNHAKNEAARMLLDELDQRAIPVHQINLPTKRGRTPLRQAAAAGFHDIVLNLLHKMKASDNIEAMDLINKADTRKGLTALHLAAHGCRTECVRGLLEHKADASLQGTKGKTALDLAIQQWNLSVEQNFEYMISLLIDSDPSAAVRNTDLITSSATNGSKAILEKLHGLGATMNQPDRFGWTPLMLARRHGQKDAEQFLVRVDSLPSRWINKSRHLEVSENGLTVKSLRIRRVCVSTDKPLSPECNKFYFEVTSKKMEGVEQKEFPEVAIGFCTIGAHVIDFPGWYESERATRALSWGYHGDDGGFANDAASNRFETNKGRRYGPGDTVGCGVDLEQGIMWVTKNGQRLDSGFFNSVRGRLFPILGFYDRAELETNFGNRPFMWTEEDSGDNLADAQDEVPNGEGLPAAGQNVVAEE